MRSNFAPPSLVVGILRYLGAAACLLLAAASLACADRDEDPAVDQQVLELDAQVQKAEEANTKNDSLFPSKEQWDKDEKSELLEGTALERTISLAACPRKGFSR